MLGGCRVCSALRCGVQGSAEQRHPALTVGCRAWHKESQAFVCFLAGLEPVPAWSLRPAVGFLQHPSITVYIDTYIYMQIDLSPAAGPCVCIWESHVFGQNCCKICVSGEGACWVCETPLAGRCCTHLYDLPLCQQEQVRSQLHGMQICLAAPRANPCCQTGV